MASLVCVYWLKAIHHEADKKLLVGLLVCHEADKKLLVGLLVCHEELQAPEWVVPCEHLISLTAWLHVAFHAYI